MDKVKAFYRKYLRNAVAFCALLSLLLNGIIESLARQTIIGGLSFFATSPLVFLYNSLIIFATLSLCILFKRRIFTLTMVSMLWLAVGITNGVILSSRMTPFTVKDLTVLSDGLSIATNYLSTTQIVLVCVGALAMVAGIVLLFIFAPKLKEKIDYKKAIAIFIVIVLGTFGVTNLAIKTNVVETFFGNLAYAYRDNGVPYCFLNTWLNTGIPQPANYSEYAVRAVFDRGELSESGLAEYSFDDDGEDHPNIIMLQLESMIDPNRVRGYTYSSDPMPFYRTLLNDYSSGFLTVPSVGAGTANTEFEIMSGMSVKFFGPGEYPYKSILLDKTCETVGSDLKTIGYSAHAIHNHRGVFYGRNEVYANLGFDTFTSLEYMNGVVKTPKNWAKDAVLIDYILDAMESTENEDFICTISVQGHGKYPTEEVLQNPAVKVVDAPSEELKWQYEYYANQVYEMDLFVKQLTEQLSNLNEDVVVVMYGDHLPALDMTEEDMIGCSLYQTEYVIWSNFEMERQVKDLSAYQLFAEVLNRLDIHIGVMTKYHQNHQDDPNYLDDMRMLEYDMLYGKNYIFGGESPFVKTNMRMGINPILIEEVVQIGEDFYLKGQNFTEFSKISLDGRILETMFLGPTILALMEEVDPEDVARMKVSQVEKNKEILSTTE